eukprot:CAMPEP_0118897314 /NCGR_PEP_ID=MMETSP1166-20130328/4766_1 /TAXON_ID=1104430 /ORGANISM="Chrysoreinhardia sp, Strain CCMP3193" /LENGTH=402 /DNA_ID=CAMNT_0006836379 /DNA_START=30 /DNA_END=1238 /DNA_ORIENTATION=-
MSIWLMGSVELQQIGDRLLASSERLPAVTKRSVSLEDDDDDVLPPPAAGFHFRGGSRLAVYRYRAEKTSVESPPRGTVVLLHGLLASHLTWDRVARRLSAEGWTVLAPDLLGFGESPWPRGSRSYDVDAHVGRVVEDVLCHATTSVHLVGHSLGGILAAEIAARAEANGGLLVRVLSVATFAIPFFPSSAAAKCALQKAPSCCCCRWQPKKKTSWRGAAVWLVLEFPVLSFVLCSLVCQQRRLWLFLARIAGGPTLRDRVASALHHSYDSVVASYRNVVETHRLSTEKLADLPVLVSHGADDDVVAPACSRNFYHALLQRKNNKARRFVVMDGVRHSCAEAAPENVSRLILWWLNTGCSAADNELPIALALGGGTGTSSDSERQKKASSSSPDESDPSLVMV